MCKIDWRFNDFYNIFFRVAGILFIMLRAVKKSPTSSKHNSPANPFKKAAEHAELKALFFTDINAVHNPARTSPVPPTVIWEHPV